MQDAITVNIGDVLDSPTHEFDIGSDGEATTVFGPADTLYLADTSTADLPQSSTLTLING